MDRSRRLSLMSFVVLAAVVAFVAAAAAQQQPPTFRTGTRLVPLYVTVTDGQGRLVPDLVQEDFEIYDNGKLQEISFFQTEVQPVTVVVMLDTSGSMTLNFDLVKRSAEQFLIRLLPDDRGRVGAFNDKIQFVSDFSSDRDMLVSSLQDLDFGYPTRLYDAIAASLDELLGIEGRRVALVFTDGDDTASKTGRGTVLARARDEEVMVYAIGFESEMFTNGRVTRTRPDRGLRGIAEETGGGYYEVKKKDELGPTFTRVAQELHSQYVVGFTPATLDGKVHKLEVRLKKAGLSPRARKSYLATADIPGARPGR